LINESVRHKHIKEAIFTASGDTHRECQVRSCEIPRYLLGRPLPTKLRIAKRWRMLDDALHDAPVHRVNIAMSIVKGGHSKILNKRLTREAFSADCGNENGQQIWTLLNRSEYWNPHDRAPDYVTLEDGDHPSPPVLPRQGLPEIGGDVLDGVELNVPLLQLGDLTVAEREEIEGLCSVSRLLKNYIREKEHNRKPISIAVFGPPGTGKSFAIKQIARDIDPREKQTEILEFNVAQFKEVKDLGVVLTNVGSVNHRGVTPLVFFDEFDCGLDGQPLSWLKYFLAPMQDGNFYDTHHTIDIGRAIFVFAGGTYPSFERFDPRSISPNEEVGLEISEEHKDRIKLFAERKGPDFISRLRGHINVSQINTDPGRVKHFIRRALILRSLIVAQGYTHPKRDKSGTALVDEEVVYALLTVDRYRHGVRSMEAIVQMCTPIDGSIHIASLPSRAQLNMHVDAEEFFIRLYRGRSRKYPENDVDDLARQLSSLEDNPDITPAIHHLADKLRKGLNNGANPSGVNQKLQILNDIANWNGHRQTGTASGANGASPGKAQ
jgi:DNA polymerase III delta prime subunit